MQAVSVQGFDIPHDHLKSRSDIADTYISCWPLLINQLDPQEIEITEVYASIITVLTMAGFLICTYNHRLSPVFAAIILIYLYEQPILTKTFTMNL
jgi:hypothetical protein